jgi:hypothetical protein
VRGQQPQLADAGLQRVRALDVVDRGGQIDHLLHAAAGVGAGEVLADPAPQVDGGADVEHLAGRPAKQIDPRPAGQALGEDPLAPLRGGDIRQVGAQVGEGVHPLVAHPLDERMQHVHGGAGVVQRAVRGLGGNGKQPRQRGQPHRGGLFAAQHPAGQPHGAQHLRPGPGDLAPRRRRPQEPDVEPGVVGDQHRVPGELEEHRQHRVDGRSIGHHRRGDAGQLHDLRRDAALRVDQRGELAEHGAAADLDRTDLGDGVGSVSVGAFRASAGGLQVDHHESGVAQRDVCGGEGRPHVGEAELSRTTGTHGRDVKRDHRHPRGSHAERIRPVRSRNAAPAGCRWVWLPFGESDLSSPSLTERTDPDGTKQWARQQRRDGAGRGGAGGDRLR